MTKEELEAENKELKRLLWDWFNVAQNLLNEEKSAIGNEIVDGSEAHKVLKILGKV